MERTIDVFQIAQYCTVNAIIKESGKSKASCKDIKKYLLEEYVSKKSEKREDIWPHGAFFGISKNKIEKFLCTQETLNANPMLSRSPIIITVNQRQKYWNEYFPNRTFEKMFPSEKDLISKYLEENINAMPSSLVLFLITYGGTITARVIEALFPEDGIEDIYCQFAQQWVCSNTDEFLLRCDSHALKKLLEITSGKNDSSHYFYQTTFRKKIAGKTVHYLKASQAKQKYSAEAKEEESGESKAFTDIGTPASKREFLHSLEAVLTEFLKTDNKYYYPLTVGTGIGKNYAVNPFARLFLAGSDVVKDYRRLVFTCDRKSIVREAYESCVQKNKKWADGILYLPSNSDNAISDFLREDSSEDKKDIQEINEDISKFKKLAFGSQDEELKEAYSILHKKVTEFWDLNKLKIDDQKIITRLKEACINDISKAEASYRKILIKVITHLDLFPHSGTPAEKYAYINSHPVFKLVGEIFPAFHLPFKKVIFLTVQKMRFPIDTLLFGKIHFFEGELPGQTFYFIDEADAVKMTLLDGICDKAARNPIMLKVMIDLGLKLATLITDGIAPSYYAEEEYVQTAAGKLQEYIQNELGSKYNSRFEFAEDITHAYSVLYHSNSNILFDRYKKQHIDKNNLGCSKPVWCVPTGINTIAITNNKKKGAFLLQDYILKLAVAARIAFSLIFGVSLEEMKHSDDVDGMHAAVRHVLEYVDTSFKDLNATVKEIIVGLVLERGDIQGKINSAHDDFYLDGFEIITATESSPGSRSVIFEYNVCHDTPEALIYKLTKVRDENSNNTRKKMRSKVVLASATAALPSIYSNFDLSWDKIAEETFVPGEKAEKVIRKYIQSRQSLEDKYVKDCLHFQIFPSKNKEKGDEAGGTKGQIWDIISGLKHTITSAIEAEVEKPQLIKTARHEIDVYGEKLYVNLISDLPKHQKDPQKYIWEIWRTADLYTAIILSCLRKAHMLLAFNPYNIPFDTDKSGRPVNNLTTTNDIKKEIYEYFQNFARSLIFTGKAASAFKKYIIYSIKSENIKERIRDSSECARKNEFLAVNLTSFSTFGKSVNAQFRVPIDEWDNIVPVNDDGAKQLAMRSPKAMIDADAVYIGNITNTPSPTNNPHNAPWNNVPEEGNAVDFFSARASQIKACFEANAGFVSGAETAQHRADVLKKIIFGNERYVLYQYALQDVHNARVRTIVQVVGRASRTPLRFKNVWIYMSGENLQKMPMSPAVALSSVAYTEEFLEKQSIEVRFCLKNMLHEITSSAQAPEEDDTARTCNLATDMFATALRKNFKDHNPGPLKALQRAVRGVYVSKEYFDSLPQDSKCLYIPVPEGAGDGYNASYTDYRKDEIYVKKISFTVAGDSSGKYSLAEKKEKYGTGIKFVAEAIKKAGLDLESTHGDYILTPKGFDVLDGHVGEAVMDHFIRMFLKINAVAVPDPIYEVVDLLYSCDDKNLLAIDAKEFYNEAGALREQTASVEMVKKFAEKKRKLDDQFQDKKVTLIVINTKPDDIQEQSYLPINKIIDHNKNHVGYGIPNLIKTSGQFNEDAVNFFYSAPWREES